MAKENLIGILPAGVGLLILATWTTNTLNAYSAGLDIVMMFKLTEESRARVTLVSGVAGKLFAVVGIMDHISFFVDFLGITFTPLAGVILADYFVLRKGKPENWFYTDGFHWAGILYWVAGIAANLLIQNDYALVIGMAGAGLAYLGLTAVRSKNTAVNEAVYKLGGK